MATTRTPPSPSKPQTLGRGAASGSANARVLSGSFLRAACVSVLTIGLVAPSVAIAQADLPSEPFESGRAPAATGEQEVAVLPLRVTNLQLNDVQRLNLLVRAGVEKRHGYVLQSAETTTELVDSALSLGLDCKVNSLDCAVSLGQLADAPLVVLGHATGFGDQIGLDVEVIDVASKRQLFRGSRLVPADLDAQEVAVRAMFLALFDQEIRAKLSVRSTPIGARLIVDGTDRGNTPQEALFGLIPGPHKIQIEIDKFKSHEETLNLKPRESADLDVVLIPLTLDRAPRTAVELALPWGVAGGGAALIAGGLVALGFGLEPLLAFNSAKDAHDSALTDPVANAQSLFDQREIMVTRRDQLNTWGIATIISGGAVATVGAAVLVGGGIWGGLVAADEIFGE